jgi:hypothetical protein
MKGIQQKITKAAAILVSVFLLVTLLRRQTKRSLKQPNRPTTKARMMNPLG